MSSSSSMMMMMMMIGQSVVTSEHRVIDRVNVGSIDDSLVGNHHM